MVVDTPLAKNALTYMTELLGRGAMDMTVLTGGKPGGGSEDFAFVSHEVPTVSMFLSAGNAKRAMFTASTTPRYALTTACCTWLCSLCLYGSAVAERPQGITIRKIYHLFEPPKNLRIFRRFFFTDGFGAAHCIS